jgi:hypothetical protein
MSSLHRGNLVQMAIKSLRMLRFRLGSRLRLALRVSSVRQNFAVQRIFIRIVSDRRLFVTGSFAGLFQRQPVLRRGQVVELGLRFVPQQTRKLDQRNRLF